MDIILLERVGKLGHMGDTVRVKDGYARNILLPRGKAFARLRLTRRSSRLSAPSLKRVTTNSSAAPTKFRRR